MAADTGGTHKLAVAVAKLQMVGALSGKENGEKHDDAPTIKVCIRVRPFIKEEISGDRSGGQTQLCIAMPTKTHCEMIPQDGEKRPRFEFDRCYWSHSADHPLYATQVTLQEELGETMIQQALSGFNNCIFAYGQTGSGKSYSVLGGKGDQRGLLPRVVEGLFDHLGNLPKNNTCKTLVAILEIYNEALRDLLAPKDEVEEHLGDNSEGGFGSGPASARGKKQKGLDIRQHPVLGTIIPGLTEAPVSSCQEVLQLVDYGTQMRMVSATAMNATSSRSHCIFTFKISVTDASGAARVSQTHLVDLAGSERSKRTGAQGDRLKEGAAINQSLSVLARVISELAKKGKMKPPFRDSKLTYILKESLCGNSKTIMMAAISPNLLDYEETFSTMKFAESVKKVQTSAVVNQVNPQNIEAQLRQELEDLRAQLAESQVQARIIDGHRVSEITRRIQEQERLCAMWGKDWDTYCHTEQVRALKRRSITRADIEELQAKFGSLQALREEDLLDGGSESSRDREHCVLVRMEAAKAVEGSAGPRSSLVAPIAGSPPHELALLGPAAERVQEDPALSAAAARRADATSGRLRELRAAVDQAQAAIDELTAAPPGARLRAVLLVDAEDPERVELAVRATRAPPGGGGVTPPDGRGAGALSHDVPEASDELLTEEQFAARNAWLQSERLVHSVDGGAPRLADAWAAAASSTAPPSGGSGSGDAAAQRAAEAEAEVADLRSRLVAAEAEAAALREEAARREEAAWAQAAAAAVAAVPAGKVAERLRAQQLRAQSVAELIRAQFQQAIEGIGNVEAALEVKAGARC